MSSSSLSFASLDRGFARHPGTEMAGNGGALRLVILPGRKVEPINLQIEETRDSYFPSSTNANPAGLASTYHRPLAEPAIVTEVRS
jgi:hypothetical protein